ncbi:hypothetical protein INR49_008366 [Caranx melampygus]|nr:hypothetical protein INR49_008366 [Caranx melampygus]
MEDFVSTEAEDGVTTSFDTEMNISGLSDPRLQQNLQRLLCRAISCLKPDASSSYPATVLSTTARISPARPCISALDMVSSPPTPLLRFIQ